MKIRNCNIYDNYNNGEIVVSIDNDEPSVLDYSWSAIKKYENIDGAIYKGEYDGLVIYLFQNNSQVRDCLPLKLKCSSGAIALVHNYTLLTASSFYNMMDESDVEPEEMDIMISFNGGEPVLTSVDLDTARQIAKEINAEIALVSSKITADAKTCLKSMQFIPKGSKEFHKGVGHHKIDKIVL